MFTRGLRGRGMGRLGEFVDRGWKEENWLKYSPQSASIIPGVPNTTTAAVAGGGIAAAVAAFLAAKYFKIF